MISSGMYTFFYKYCISVNLTNMSLKRLNQNLGIFRNCRIANLGAWCGRNYFLLTFPRGTNRMYILKLTRIPRWMYTTSSRYLAGCIGVREKSGGGLGWWDNLLRVGVWEDIFGGCGGGRIFWGKGVNRP